MTLGVGSKWFTAVVTAASLLVVGVPSVAYGIGLAIAEREPHPDVTQSSLEPIPANPSAGIKETINGYTASQKYSTETKIQVDSCQTFVYAATKGQVMYEFIYRPGCKKEFPNGGIEVTAGPGDTHPKYLGDNSGGGIAVVINNADGTRTVRLFDGNYDLKKTWLVVQSTDVALTSPKCETGGCTPRLEVPLTSHASLGVSDWGVVVNPDPKSLVSTNVVTSKSGTDVSIDETSGLGYGWGPISDFHVTANADGSTTVQMVVPGSKTDQPQVKDTYTIS